MGLFAAKAVQFGQVDPWDRMAPLLENMPGLADQRGFESREGCVSRFRQVRYGRRDLYNQVVVY